MISNLFPHNSKFLFAHLPTTNPITTTILRVTISPTLLMGRLPDSASTARSAATLKKDSSCNEETFWLVVKQTL